MTYTTNSPVFDYPYSPKPRDWPAHPAMTALKNKFDQDSASFLNLLSRFAELDPLLAKIPQDGDPAGTTPFWNNIWLPPLDAITLCGMLTVFKPSRYLEVGSGNSTKFARWSINTLNLRTKITSVEPYPRDDMHLLAHHVIKERLEDIPQDEFRALERGDIVFIDNSHRSFMSSDVTIFFMEILPLLKRGVIVGIHDIFLPYDYPEAWIERFYNEQYLLAAYIFGGFDGGHTLFPVHYMGRFHTESLQAAFPSLARKGVHATGGGIFFFSR
ncbi:class I SAM-dependent methyltransferase [Phenylobacterium sp. VNQ135]|uniref:class I SAM-dependent methyltransferase n=1 Tax=Phenylobacterium sp. VNQ135 TaxID=3400922 RepID=UPI003BFC445A